MSHPGSGLLERIIAAGLSPIRRVTLAITNGCNLSCAHCWPDSRVSSLDRPVPEETVVRLIGDCAQLGAENLCITGGEPLTHPAWAEILHHACTAFAFKEVCLQTNATLLAEGTAAILAAPALKSVLIQVSLDGAAPPAHERVRGRGSYHRTIRALELLASAGLAGRTRVAFTEMEHNFGELPGLLEKMDALGIGKVVSGTLVKGGRAASSARLAPPTPAQYERVLGLYLSDERFRETYEKIGETAAIEWYKGRAHDARIGCSFLEHPYIAAEGLMYPCEMLQAEKFALRGIHERPLAEVLPQVLPTWSWLLAESRRRAAELDACRECIGLRHCAGGCMGRALTASGNLMAAEDRCPLRQAIYQA